jgi:hypothetical protein
MAETTAKDLLSEPVQVSVRFDSVLLQLLKDSARREFRSVNAEVSYRIRASFTEHSGAPSAKAA